MTEAKDKHIIDDPSLNPTSVKLNHVLDQTQYFRTLN